MSPQAKTVYLHIGEPKSGTTFLQHVLWGNREELGRQSLLLPGHHLQDHYRASQDVLSVVNQAGEQTGSWTGEWELLARQALATDKRALISHELFCPADRDQAQRAVSALSGADVHVVLTVRNVFTLLPAEWQESVKHRYDRTFAEWLDGVIDDQAPRPDRRRFWFWRVHDTMEILRIWSELVGPERTHVVLMPGPQAPTDELWRRFAGVVGVDPGSVDLGRARRNEALGVAETEFLRRMNAELDPELPEWFYLREVKEALAHDHLATREGASRLVLPPQRWEWAAEHSRNMMTELAASPYDVVGDLEDLAPRPATGEYRDPDTVPDAELLDIAVRSVGVVALNHFHQEQDRTRKRSAGGPRQPLMSRIEARVADSPRLKRAIRDVTARSATVRRLRVVVWTQMEKARARRSG